MLEATKNAIEVPLKVMSLANDSFSLLKKMALQGNQNSISDAGVGALCAKTAVYGAYLNVKINCKDLDDAKYVKSVSAKANKILKAAQKSEKEILAIVEKAL